MTQEQSINKVFERNTAIMPFYEEWLEKNDVDRTVKSAEHYAFNIYMTDGMYKVDKTLDYKIHNKKLGFFKRIRLLFGSKEWFK